MQYRREQTINLNNSNITTADDITLEDKLQEWIMQLQKKSNEFMALSHLNIQHSKKWLSKMGQKHKRSTRHKNTTVQEEEDYDCQTMEDLNLVTRLNYSARETKSYRARDRKRKTRSTALDHDQRRE